MKIKSSRRAAYAALTAVIAAAGLCIMLACSNYFPFGTDSILVIDLGTQYTDFLLFFKNSTLMEKLYSFQKGFGGPAVGMLSYYTLSPFNFIAYFFRDADVETAVFCIILAKFIFMALAAYRYFSHHYENRPLNTAFALAYAFYPFFTRLFYHILWLDCFRLLPLLVLACERVIDKKGRGLFVGLYCYALISNYYIAFMCSIFILLYFFWYCAINSKTINDILAAAADMAIAVLQAVMLCAPVLLPSLVQLFSGKLTAGHSTPNWGENLFSVPAALATFFDGTVFYRVPQLAGSLVFLLFMAVYFCRKDITAKEKAVTALFYRFMVFSLYNGVLYHIWHGFAQPMDFPYRHTFAYAFLLLFICRKAVENIDVSRAFRGTAGFVMLAGGILLAMKGKIRLPGSTVAFSAVLCTVCLVAFILSATDRKKTNILLSAVVVFAALSNGCAYMKAEKDIYCGLYPPLPAGEYRENYQQVTAALGKTGDAGFYRVADITARDYNQPMGTGYYGTNHYSSTFDSVQKQMFVHFGYRDTYYSTIYDHSHVVTDSLFGIKYLLSSETDSYDSHYPLLDKGERNLYTNPYALPLLFTGDTAAVEYSQDGLYHADNMFFALTGHKVLNYDKSVDYASLQAASSQLQAQSATDIKENGAVLKFTARGKYLLSTIIYDENWHIKVNGRAVQSLRFMEHFLAFPLEEGRCTVQMVYIPGGFVPGCVMCITAAVWLFICHNINRKKKEI